MSSRSIFTDLSHLVVKPDVYDGNINVPIYQASTLMFETHQKFIEAKEKGGSALYGRYGTNTTLELIEFLKKLENAKTVFLTPSGLSSISFTLLSILKTGDHVLLTEGVYPPVKSCFKKLFTHFNIEYDLYNPTASVAEIEKMIKPNTKLLYLESPSSSTFEVQDIPALVQLAKSYKINSFLDGTWATPLYFRALDFGVDIVCQAATKYYSGHSDIFLGTIATNNDEIAEQLRVCHAITGIKSNPLESHSLLRSLRTLALRLERISKGALIVAKWLEEQKEIGFVNHPALESHPNHDIWKRDFKGSGSLFSFSFKEDYNEEVIAKFVDNLKLFGIGLSWGGFESLVTLWKTSEFREVNTDKHLQNQCLVRLNVGLEDTKDLIDDIEKSLHYMQK